MQKTWKSQGNSSVQKSGNHELVNQFQTQICPQSLKWQINVALLVLMLVLITIVTKQDLAMKSENHLGIGKVVKVYHVTMLQCSQSLSRDKFLKV